MLWGPVAVGTGLGIAGFLMRPTRFGVTLGVVGSAFAGTLLVVGGGLGIGPGGNLLIGTELRWVWRICIVCIGLVIGLAGPALLGTHADDHSLDFRALRRAILLSGAVLGVLILLLTPGPFVGKVMAGMGSWLGSLVWVVGL
jgi:hypothetical protein